MIATAVDEAVVATAAFGLPGAVRRLPDSPLDEVTWRQYLGRVREQRVPGFLAAAVEQGAFPVTPSQAEDVQDEHLSSMLTVLLLERLLMETSEALSARGVEHRVLKGPALAHTLYPDPALRSFGDIDILVPSDAYDTAAAVLAEAGCRRMTPERRPGFDRRFSKGATFVTEDRFEIDLHRTLAMGPFGQTIQLGDLFATTTPFSLGGQQLHGLGGAERFLHGCFHAALGDIIARLVPQRDVAQMLLNDGLDVGRVRDLCAEWRAEAVVARGIALTWTTFAIADATPLSVWASQYRFDRQEQQALQVYTLEGRPRKNLAAVRGVTGVRAKAAYLRALAFPERDFVRQRDHGYLRRWRRGARTLLGREH